MFLYIGLFIAVNYNEGILEDERMNEREMINYFESKEIWFKCFLAAYN